MADPKKINGDKKTPLHLIPTVAETSMANALSVGEEKYGRYNWRESGGVEAMTYAGAIRRHLNQWLDGEEADDESGESHLGHIMAGCAILLDAGRVGTIIDNRPKINYAQESEKNDDCNDCSEAIKAAFVRNYNE